MLKILVLIMFLVPTMINYKHKRENIAEVKKKSKEMIGVVALLIVGSFICYKFDNTIIGYLIAFAATIMLYTSVFFQGITEEGINIFLATSPILKFVKFDEINTIDMKENDKDELLVTIEAYGTTFVQVYNKETGMNIFKDN
ncbi:hypothetical protein [Peptoniphilus duerdenii]|uniref:hypothetical protein n=1 Tax=Peptoniphilus duerdenii TaxID=507750 RepID=UPI00288979A4|nr:hypothetical protein [Peptoniphilus duerdenii]